MIKAICDECGKEITLRYFECGLENPPGWGIETQLRPLTRDYGYRTYCPDCNPRMVKKVGE